MDSVLDYFDAWLLVLILALAMLATWGLGLRMRRRLRARDGKPRFKIEQASLVLVTLLLACAFGMSTIKHERQRETVVVESDAICEFYTCASLLKDPLRTKLQAVIRQYQALRLEVARPHLDEDTFESALHRFQQMHSQMTDLVAEAVGNDAPVAVPLVNALNKVKSNDAARLAARSLRIGYFGAQ